MNNHLDQNLGIIRGFSQSNSVLLNKLNALADWTAENLENKLFVDYTDHGLDHSKRLVGFIDDLLIRFINTSDSLNAKEMYILFASCYLHDLGMHYEYVENTSVFNDLKSKYKINFNLDNRENLKPKQREKIHSIIRKEHHEIAKALINKGKICSNGCDINISGLDNDLKTHIGEVCRGHGLNSNELKELKDNELDGSDIIRLQLLSRLLRIADVLDVSHERINPSDLALRYISRESKLHLFKHYYTQGIKPDMHGTFLEFRLPCDEKDENSPYTIIAEWTINELIDEERIHKKYLKEKKYNIISNIDISLNVSWRKPNYIINRSSILGSSSSSKEISSGSLIEMDEKLLDYLSEYYNEIKIEKKHWLTLMQIKGMYDV